MAKTFKQFMNEIEQIEEGGTTYNKHSFIGKIRRAGEADSKGLGLVGKVISATKEKNQPEAEKAIKNSNRYYKLTHKD